MSQLLYGERSWNPLARTVELTEYGLRRGGRTTPLSELNLGAMADAFLRGYWLGGGGAERPLGRLTDGPGAVPVTRATGTTKPVKVRQVAEFARTLGELAVRHCGGPEQVTALAARAHAEGVPLWIARRFAPGPVGPIAVAVDRSLVRVDVWGPHAPVVRIRAPYGFQGEAGTDPSQGLHLTIGNDPAQLLIKRKVRKSKSRVEVRLRGQHWELRRENAKSSWLLRNEARVALLTRPRGRPEPEPGTILLPLTPIHHESPDPLDAVMAHLFAVAFGFGDTTGAARFRRERRRRHGIEPIALDEWWDRAWYSNLGQGRDDNEPGGSDGWGADGGDGGDSGGSDGGGGGGDGGGGGGGD
ncbi:hypothetical protein OHT76_38715 [Streptomyces sp. NBC_00287]|uniref:hypothetical protein n=1 Tax=Streptomyces sp. NBC_00287 TaxID=2975702 RepID=UPI002E28258D|nr:hypothetical protein [Streptomyces sp. NBC_00287]